MKSFKLTEEQVEIILSFLEEWDPVMDGYDGHPADAISINNHVGKEIDKIIKILKEEK